MDIFYISETQTSMRPAEEVLALLSKQSNGIHLSADAAQFLWLDVTHDEVAADAELWRDQVEQLTGIRIFDLHLKDVCNLSHPSYFDATQDYELVVFQKLALNGNSVNGDSATKSDTNHKKIPAALHRLQTQPVSFLLLGNALITVRSNQSRTIEGTRQRLLAYRPKQDATAHASRLPSSPEDLMLRMLNSMVDQYLDLRQPLTVQLDRWQHALLDPRKPFNNWVALLDSRVELRKLDHLCEEQYDALQELRDHFVDTYDAQTSEPSRAKDLLLVRTNDVMEHINRVLNHARRLESSLESSVQIHFAAMAHRTSDIMRMLTIITAVFMPLTLITGIFGMNFDSMPLVKKEPGFYYVVGSMIALLVIPLVYFYRQHYFNDKKRHTID